MFDEDEAGRHGRDGIWKDGDLKLGALQRLASKVYVRVIGLGEEGTQPDGLSTETLVRYLGGQIDNHRHMTGRSGRPAQLALRRAAGFFYAWTACVCLG